MRTYSTEEVARLAKIHRVTLQRWVTTKRVRASRAVPIKGRTLWRWTKADVKKVRKYKAAHYWEGRGAKKKSKA